MRRKSFIILFLLILLVVFQRPLAAHLKALLLISQEFPQIPVKPLEFVTREPRHEHITFTNGRGNAVVADIFYPSTPLRQTQGRSGQAPAVIIAMGVKTADKDKPLLTSFAKTLARLGYVAMWPRLKILDEGKSSFEDPETLITAFEYLKDPERSRRVSFIGFSVGSSIALVAAEDPAINEKVRSLVFFGGYYDVFDYLASIKNPTNWQPDEGAINHVKEILEENHIDILRDREVLERYNPSKNISNFKSRIFILHEKSDSYVPYFESAKLHQALEGLPVKKDYLVVNIFEHVQPKKPLSAELVGELFKLYFFVARIFEYF